MGLEGKNIILREERSEDLPKLVGLRNDMDTQAWSKALPPAYTLSMYQKRYDSREFSYDPDEGRFIIEDKETGHFAGTISYTGLDGRLSTTIGIMVDKQFWGKDVAFDAQETLLEFLFVQLGVRVVHLWTHSGNVRAMGLAQKSGFRVAFRQREAVFKDGKLLDNVNMDMLREEYFALHPELEDELPAL